MEDLWVDIPGYEGLYQASQAGLVRRIGKDGQQARVLKAINHPRGYFQVTLSKSGRTKKMLVHRLVAAAFHGFQDAVVNHIDGNKRHNQASNLEWATQGANVEHYWNMQANREARRKSKESLETPIDF